MDGFVKLDKKTNNNNLLYSSLGDIFHIKKFKKMYVFKKEFLWLAPLYFWVASFDFQLT